MRPDISTVCSAELWAECAAARLCTGEWAVTQKDGYVYTHTDGNTFNFDWEGSESSYPVVVDGDALFYALDIGLDDVAVYKNKPACSAGFVF